MRYIDTGSRDPAHALGHWLKSAVELDSSVAEVRWQAGFFSSVPLAYFEAAMKRLAQANGVLRLLVGSNGGETQRADIETLLTFSGPPRSRRQIGIVKFNNAFFHPKTIHIVRTDGSEAAYVGSANLTSQGVNGLHVEGGILLDTKDGDDGAVVARIKQAIDWWFAKSPEGLNLVSKSSDLDALVQAGILDVQPAIPVPSVLSKNAKLSLVANLKPLLTIPIVLTPAPVMPTKAGAVNVTAAASAVAQWSKKLSPSDAQRKKSGNQRGGITLVGAGYPINWKTYFRNDFFKSVPWKLDPKKPGKKREHCFVPFHVNFLGKPMGKVSIEISHDKDRESGQSNYTSELHLGPVLSTQFKLHDVTGRTLDLVRDSTGAFSMSIL
ncbi:MAG: hypothetical protein WAL80_15310 [Xanthobacteraceae bacterium]